MNYYTVMAQSFEKEKNKQASLITAMIAILMLLAFVFLKWPLPTIEIPPQEAFIEIQLDQPEDIRAGGGGGGGNPVQATGKAGPAYSPPQPGTLDDTKDFETNDKDETNPPVVKPANPKPEVTKVNTNTSTVKTTPKPVVIPPAPPKPKAVVGKTLTGTGTGGGAAENYDRSGGSGTGNGVGNGSGNGGGTGTGSGGGNGSGTGTGTGPRRVRGNRVVITSGKLDAGENISGKVEAEIRVSADGVGTLVRTVRGSLMSDGQAKEIIRDWLRRNRFNKMTEESVVVYEFNIRTGG